MKFTLSWLKEYLDTTATLEEISTKLTDVGLEVDEIHDPAKMLDGFVVGHVVECGPHPDADKLQCLVVDNGTEKVNVVCGAPNAKKGMKGVFAPVKAYVPGIDLTLKKAKIRGQESHGMLCSERELLISEEHNGIIELPDDLEVGSSAAEALGMTDPVIEIALTPNRGDCAGIRGIARDLAAAGLGTLKALDATPVKGTFKSDIDVKIEDTDACPQFIGRYIKGVKNGASPKWMQDRLNAIGLRPISMLVDITNYFSIAYGRPLHVFDADKLKGNISVRLSKEGEEIEALNDKSYTLQDGMTVVCDDTGVLALGGVVGGVGSSVSDETTNVYLEVAYFDPACTAKTGQKMQIDSDARYRFERGIDPAFTADGAELATQMILDTCGGEASENVVAGSAPDITHVISFNPECVKLLGGSDVAVAKQKDILTALGFEVNDSADTWQVKTPSWRHDVDGSADIVEEILRIDGYDNIPYVYISKEAGEGVNVFSPLQTRMNAARQTLAMRGLCETVTWSFMAEAAAELFGVNDNGQKEAMTLVNPISVDLSVMRPSVLPNLIEAAGRNADRGIMDASFFELGNIYKTPEAEGQMAVATGLRSGNTLARHWSGPARAVDVYDVKADALAVLEVCGVSEDRVQISSENIPSWYHPGRSGALRQGREVLAYFGEIHPAVLAEMKRDEVIAGFEVFLQKIPVPKKKTAQKKLLKPSAFQPVLRDFAFIVDAAVEVEKLTRAIKSSDKKLIVAVEIFDVYTGKGVDDGKKSVALSVTLQPVEKTLTDEEIAGVSKKIIELVEKQTGGVLRG